MEIQKELELKKLEFQAHNQRPDSSQSKSDIARYSSLILRFDANNVEVFFTQFEKQVQGLGLAKEKWAFLLRSALIGKALEAICTLSVEQGSDYEFLKKTVLAAYQLVPEAYRQKFRGCKKQESQTYVEFARKKELLFDKWCHSKEVSDFKDLRQLMLVEEFQRCVGEDVKTYLTGQKVNDLTTAAVTADEYALLHKPKQFKSDKKFHKQSSNIPNQNSFGNKSDGDNMPNSIPTCAYCHKKGHVMSKCFKLAQSKKDGEVSTNALTVLDRPPQEKVINSKVLPDNHDTKIKEGYLPFVSEGYLSLSGDSTQQPVKVNMLRDTGATQSLLLKGVLPLSEQTAVGANVIISGVECGYVSVPLHKICIKSDLVSGEVTVGVRPTLPVKGV